MRFITIRPKALAKNQELFDKFNSGEFVRSDYKYLFHVKMWRGSMRVFLYTPSLAQVWYTVKSLLFGPVWHGKPYERNGHPVQLQVFNIEDIAQRYFTPAEIEKHKAAAKVGPHPIAAHKRAKGRRKSSGKRGK